MQVGSDTTVGIYPYLRTKNGRLDACLITTHELVATRVTNKVTLQNLNLRDGRLRGNRRELGKTDFLAVLFLLACFHSHIYTSFYSGNNLPLVNLINTQLISLSWPLSKGMIKWVSNIIRLWQVFV